VTPQRRHNLTPTQLKGTPHPQERTDDGGEAEVGGIDGDVIVVGVRHI
jgi:hypothetical protein